jgi:hypothetical protein
MTIAKLPSPSSRLGYERFMYLHERVEKGRSGVVLLDLGVYFDYGSILNHMEAEERWASRPGMYGLVHTANFDLGRPEMSRIFGMGFKDLNKFIRDTADFPAPSVDRDGYVYYNKWTGKTHKGHRVRKWDCETLLEWAEQHLPK